MNFLIIHIQRIMLVSGILTCSMLLTIFAPDLVLNNMFGATLDGPLAQIMVRSWGVLVTLTGAMLIYGAYSPSSRALVLIVAAVSKLCFVGLIVIYGQAYLDKAMSTIVIDLLMALLFVSYLLAAKPRD